MIDFHKSNGLVPAIAQDADTGEVLMLAWMNRESYEETLRTGRAVTSAAAGASSGVRARKVGTSRRSRPSTWTVMRIRSC